MYDIRDAMLGYDLSISRPPKLKTLRNSYLVPIIQNKPSAIIYVLYAKADVPTY